MFTIMMPWVDERGSEIPTEVLEANRDWWARVRKVTHTVRYDRQSDTLFVTFGKPAEASAIEVGRGADHVNLRVAFDDLAITGWDVEDFTEFLGHHKDIAEVFKCLGGTNESWELPADPTDEADIPSEAIACVGRYLRQVQKGLRQVIPA